MEKCPGMNSDVVLYLNSSDLNLLKVQTKLNEFSLHFCVSCVGCIARTVSSPNQHLLRSEDVVSCCLDLSVPSISFRINGQPVQGMFENFNSDGLFFPVASFSAGVKSVFHWSSSTQHDKSYCLCSPWSLFYFCLLKWICNCIMTISTTYMHITLFLSIFFPLLTFSFTF